MADNQSTGLPDDLVSLRLALNAEIKRRQSLEELVLKMSQRLDRMMEALQGQ